MNVENIEVTSGHSVAVFGQAKCTVVKRQYQCSWLQKLKTRMFVRKKLVVSVKSTVFSCV
jgi:hypothetical protein